MILLLMRHGIAEVIEDDGSDLDDAQRELTKKGRKRVTSIARFLRDSGLAPDFCLSSPRLRALQTGLIVSELCEAPTGPKRVDSLDFGGTWGEFVKDVRRVTRGRRKCVVLATGHEPCMGDFLAQALVPAHHAIPFRKGAVAAISWEGGIAEREGRLLFYMTAAAARRK